MIQVYIILSIAVLVLLLRYIKLQRLSNRVELESLRYNFFSVRDDLIKLVAEGKLTKDDFLFREFYPMVNDFIVHIKEIRLEPLLEMSESQLNHMESNEFADKFMQEYENVPEEVKEAFSKFFTAFEMTLIYNSSILGLTIWLIKIKLIKLTNLLMKYVIKIISPLRYDAYRYYNDVQDLKMRLRVS